MGGELCADGPAVEEGPKLPAGRLNKTAAKWTRTPCPSGRGKWRRTGKVDRWGALGDARRAVVCEGARGGRHHVVAWAGRKAIVLRGLRREGAAKGPDGSKGFALMRTSQRRVATQGRTWALWNTDAERGTRASVWRSAKLWEGKVRLWGRNGLVALCATLFVKTLQIATGTGCIAACFSAVLMALPCAFAVLTFATGGEQLKKCAAHGRMRAQRFCRELRGLCISAPCRVTRALPRMGESCACAAGQVTVFLLLFVPLLLGAAIVHVRVMLWPPEKELTTIWRGWQTEVAPCLVRRHRAVGLLWLSFCREGGEDEGEEEEEARGCRRVDCWCRHTGAALSRKRCGTASAETGCRRRKASAKLQSKVWDPGRSPGAKHLAKYGSTSRKC